MGHFAYLINSDAASNNTSHEILDAIRHVSFEGPRYVYPLAWICCFRTNDLNPYTVVFKKGSKCDLQVPVTSVERAIENLSASLPRYERLIGDEQTAREFWQESIDAIKTLPLRYITLRIDDLISLDSNNAKSFVQAFSSPSDPLSGSDELFEYEAGVSPKRSKQNARVLDCPAYDAATDPYVMHAKMFKHCKAGAEQGVPGHMFNLGLLYLKGHGTEKNIEEGLRWCTNASKAGWEQAATLLYSVHNTGGYGVPIDKEKAAYWERIIELRRAR